MTIRYPPTMKVYLWLIALPVRVKPAEYLLRRFMQKRHGRNVRS